MGHEEVDMFAKRALSLICLAPLVLLCLAPCGACEEGPDDYELFVSVDETKVSLISGNLSVAVTRAWPRVVFWHTFDPFSPTFDVGFPKLYLFNDTDGDGRFAPEEAEYTVYLDSMRVDWDLSPVESDFAPGSGEFAAFHMRALADAYDGSSDSVPAIESWANVSFSFHLAENDTVVETAGRPYPISGRTELRVDMALEVVNGTDCTSLAIERFLQGGGTTDMFRIMEDGPGGEVSATVSSRVDETLLGEDYVRPLNGTGSPVQSVEFSKEDGLVQAVFGWGSAADLSLTNGSGVGPVNSSCYTNGAGMVLHSSLGLANGSVEFSHFSVLGLVESGFVGGMTDWVKEYAYVFVAVAAVVCAVALTSLHLALRRRRLRSRSAGPGAREDTGRPPA